GGGEKPATSNRGPLRGRVFRDASSSRRGVRGPEALAEAVNGLEEVRAQVPLWPPALGALADEGPRVLPRWKLHRGPRHREPDPRAGPGEHGRPHPRVPVPLPPGAVRPRGRVRPPRRRTPPAEPAGVDDPRPRPGEPRRPGGRGGGVPPDGRAGPEARERLVPTGVHRRPPRRPRRGPRGSRTCVRGPAGVSRRG